VAFGLAVVGGFSIFLARFSGSSSSGLSSLHSGWIFFLPTISVRIFGVQLFESLKYGNDKITMNRL
jgi:hypothetical protein